MPPAQDIGEIAASGADPLRVATHTVALAEAAPTPRALREACSRYPTGVVAVCADVDGVPTAMVATSFTVGVSFDPPLVSLSIQNSSATWPRLRSSDILGISVLSEDQVDACLQLASRTRDRFAGLEIARCERDQALLVEGASMWLEGKVHTEVPAGDHTIVLIRLVALKVHDSRPPLVYHAMGFRSVDKLSAARR